MIKKHLPIILSLAICGVMVFSATKVKADTAYPTTIHDIESVGTYHFNYMEGVHGSGSDDASEWSIVAVPLGFN